MFAGTILGRLLLLAAGALGAPAGNDIQLALYTSQTCKTASTITPNATVGLQVCAVTPGLVSYFYTPIGCSGGGKLTAYSFADTQCHTSLGVSVQLSWYDSTCMTEYNNGETITAIMMSCNEDDPGSPVSATTIPVAPVATPPPGSSSSSGSSSDSSSGSQGSSSGSGSSSGWDALPQAARIVIIVIGAIVGVVGGSALVFSCCNNSSINCCSR